MLQLYYGNLTCKNWDWETWSARRAGKLIMTRMKKSVGIFRFEKKHVWDSLGLCGISFTVHEWRCPVGECMQVGDNDLCTEVCFCMQIFCWIRMITFVQKKGKSQTTVDLLASSLLKLFGKRWNEDQRRIARLDCTCQVYILSTLLNQPRKKGNM